jgi:hypothetical protein
MIAPNVALSISRQCRLLGIARSNFYYQPRPPSAAEPDLLSRLDRFHRASGIWQPAVAGGVVARGDFRRTSAHPTIDA